MFNDTCILYGEEIKTDEYRNQKKTLDDGKEVFCSVRSIGCSEFYSAAVTDFKPELEIILPDKWDYDGQKIVGYNDVLYNVIRTYEKFRTIELTLERRISNEERF